MIKKKVHTQNALIAGECCWAKVIQVQVGCKWKNNFYFQYCDRVAFLAWISSC